MKPDTCEIVIVRHGETTANHEGILQGQMDVPLNENGIRQAEYAAERLQDETFDAVYSSDLSRAFQTAEVICKHHPELKIIPVRELREWNLGELQGKTITTLHRDYANVMESFKRCQNEDICVPGGETTFQFQARIGAFLDEIAQKHAGQRLLFVSHGGAIQRIFIHITGAIAPQNVIPLCDNASVSLIRHTPNGWRLITWNSTDHLRNIEKHELLAY